MTSAAQGSPGGLAGARVLITRPREDGTALATRIAAAGGAARCVPLIRIAPPEDAAPLAAARQQLAAYDWVLLTSRHAARAILSDAEPGGVQLAVVGAGTAAAARALGWRADCEATGRGAPALAAALLGRDVRGTRILYPHSNLAQVAWIAELERAGAEVVALEAYRTLPPGPSEEKELRAARTWAHAVVFASPSAVRNFLAVAGMSEEYLRERIAVAIGATTRAALMEVGWRHSEQAAEPDDAGLCAALCAAWRRWGDYRSGEDTKHGVP